MSNYQKVSGTAFAVVSAGQLTRAITEWPVRIGTFDLPVWMSYVAFAVTATLAIWACRTPR
jgi:hypothetical protein